MRLAVTCIFALGCSATHVAAVDDGDAGPRVRATPEAGADDGGDAGSGFCAKRSPRATFCDDFEAATLGAAWDLVQQSPPGLAARDLAAFVSPPASLTVTTKRLGPGDLGSIFLRKTVTGTASRAVLGFDVYADDPQPEGTLAIATLDLSLDHLLTLYLLDDDPVSPGATLTETPAAGATRRNPLARVPPAGTWTRIEVEVDAAAGLATVRVGGVIALRTGIAKAPAIDPTIRVGALVTGPASPYTLRFDDVTLDLFP